ncbi:MAG TPA: type II secretion system protein [Mesotoga infera]|nr:type II secretion system protein [Mesotoga infera]
MKNRKKGFSLVELLIVLAVMAALIATITPVALNAIRKSQATKVGQNIKTLASAFENALYVNGDVPDSISSLGRDIDSSKYGVYYTDTNGTYTVAVITSEDVDRTTLEGVIQDIETGDYTGTADQNLTGGFTGTSTFYYEFSFTVY